MMTITKISSPCQVSSAYKMENPSVSGFVFIAALSFRVI